MSIYMESRPEPLEEWRFPKNAREVAEELDLCGVPLDANPAQARVLLELNGTWACRAVVADALRWRTRLSTMSGHSDS
ncbi:hypothetical protein ACFOOK_07565 [Micromonospora krabiensis]|uniref:hypothetical protein n=1 Tax=Micromonospora krabiensis TaxID=307121 RepID=UPI000B80A677|nr:hypothetical protein [Micromonospora krabiensis]